MSKDSSPSYSFDSDTQPMPEFHPGNHFRGPVLPSSARPISQNGTVPSSGSGPWRERQGPAVASSSSATSGGLRPRGNSTLPPAPTLGSSQNARHVQRFRGSTIHIVSPPKQEVGSDGRPRRLTVNSHEVPSSPAAGHSHFNIGSRPVREAPRPSHGSLSPARVLPSPNRSVHRRSTMLLVVGSSAGARQTPIVPGSPTPFTPVEHRPYVPLRPPPLSASQSRSWVGLQPESSSSSRRPRAYTDIRDRLQLRENMLAIIPPCERPSGAAFGHGTMINTAVSRLLLGNGGRGSPLPLNGGRRISTSSTMSTEQMLHHKVSVSSSMGHSDATLVEEYSKANTYHHATSFFPTMERGLEASRMRSLPALRLPQGPFPELPQPPPHRIRSSSFRRDVVRSSLDEDVDRSSGEFQQRARRLSQSVDEEDEEEDSRQAMDIDRDSPHGRSSTPVLGSSRPHKRHRSSSPPTEIMQLSMQKNSAAAPEARAERSESRFPSLSEMGLIAQMRITPRQ